jgi:hypothetical protein
MRHLYKRRLPVLTFTRPLIEPNQNVSSTSTWIFAVGLPNNSFQGRHQIFGSFQFELTACYSEVDGPTPSPAPGGASITFLDATKPNKALWIVHGIVLTVAWAVLTPIGIGVSLLRNALDSAGYAKGTWYKIHFYSNLLSVLFTIIGLGIATFLVEQEESETHFDGIHQRLGLAILLLAVLQGAAAYFRPDLPKPQNNDEEDQEQVSSKKTKIRLAWEIGHRFLGSALVAMAWYNCHKGIELQVENWEDQKDWTVTFWSITAGLISLLLLFGFVQKLISSKRSGDVEYK